MFSYLKNAASGIKDLIVVWAAVVATLAWVSTQISNCDECFELYKAELLVAVITLSGLAIFWAMNKVKFNKVHDRLDFILDRITDAEIMRIKGEVDRLYRALKNEDTLAADDAAYLYKLKDMMKTHSINSFTQRKIQYLLDKDIK